jgi:hypothetical protein
MDDSALLDCVKWIALGYEVVRSVFPDGSSRYNWLSDSDCRLLFRTFNTMGWIAVRSTLSAHAALCTPDLMGNKRLVAAS